MKLTVKRLERAFDAAGLRGLTLTKESGTYYFYGPETYRWYNTCALVTRLDSLTVEEWVDEAVRLSKQRP
jgi:hypothetical protein